MLMINGARGEGGGQILRSALTLAVILGRAIRVEHIRAGRKSPGLAAQHLLSLRAAARICKAHVSGDELGSTAITFEPAGPVIPGHYEFDVASVRQGGSAGAVTLVLQTILLPLALAEGPSTVVLRGGTHVAWSPSYHYVRDVYLPALARLGVEATVELAAWGWYPAGQGQIRAAISGGARLRPAGFDRRGPLRRVRGLAVAANLPAHIPQRMASRAANLLRQAGMVADIEPKRVRAASPGAGIFLTAEYEHIAAGFSALGSRGKPSETVATEAVQSLLAYRDSDQTLDVHLADQLVLPLALSGGETTLNAVALSQHTLTNLWVTEQFLGPVAGIDRRNRQLIFGKLLGIKA